MPVGMQSPCRAGWEGHHEQAGPASDALRNLDRKNMANSQRNAPSQPSKVAWPPPAGPRLAMTPWSPRIPRCRFSLQK